VNRVVSSAVAVSAALLLALTGCSADKTGSGQAATAGSDQAAEPAKPADPKVALASAVRKTDERNSARITMQMTTGPAQVQAKGIMKFTAPLTGELDMSLSQKGGNTQKMQARYTPDAIYIGGGELAAQTGKKWIRMGYADLAKLGGPGAGAALVQQMDQGQDPRQYLKLMLASQDLTVVGTEAINGAAATHYRGTIDLGKALADAGQLTKLSAKERAALKRQFDAMKLNAVKADIWVSADGWPVRIVQQGSIAVGSFTVRFDMSDFGIPVTVNPPPAAEVQDFAAMLGR